MALLEEEKVKKQLRKHGWVPLEEVIEFLKVACNEIGSEFHLIKLLRQKYGKEKKMKQEMNEIEINGVSYVRKDNISTKAQDLDGMEYCIVRTYSAGVFAGYIDTKKEGKENIEFNARRIWYWAGAASLSQLAKDGTSKPENCKFPESVDKIYLKEIIEIIPCTEKAKKSIDGVEAWKK